MTYPLTVELQVICNWIIQNPIKAGSPGDPTGTPGDPPGTPGDPPGTPGDPPGTPGDPPWDPPCFCFLGGPQRADWPTDR